MLRVRTGWKEGSSNAWDIFSILHPFGQRDNNFLGWIVQLGGRD